MVFASLTFLFGFLPLALLVYYAVPLRLRNGVLLLLNLIFYGWGEPILILVMLFSTAVNGAFGLFLEKAKEKEKRRKALAAAAISIDLSLLIFFKYTGLFTGALQSIPFLSFLPQISVPLPLGISFYTFHVISYIVDVYRGDAPAQKNPLLFGMYISLFPQMIAGPITRYKQMQSQLAERRVTRSQFHDGVALIVVGLVKKVLLANQMGKLWDVLRDAGSSAGLLGAWAGTVAYALQIYFDFGGYTDMARGLGKLFGFELPINFNYPYTARSVTDFWRRWHMTLSGWFQDYVYIPLGGSRKGTAVTLRNLLIVWCLTGFWHGASWNFLLWGFYYFVLLAVEKLFLLPILERAPAPLAHGYAVLTFLFGWMLFANAKFGVMSARLALMCGFGRVLPDAAVSATLISYLPLLAVGIVGCLPVVKKLAGRAASFRLRVPMECAGCVIAVTLCTASLLSQSYNPFLYFRF